MVVVGLLLPALHVALQLLKFVHEVLASDTHPGVDIKSKL
jgi:hypothetical protein